jgi:NADH dehydrogenase
MASANAIRKHIVEELRAARDTNKVPHRTTVVVGAGIHGVEAICAARELALELCERNYLFPYEVEHVLIDGHAVPDPVPERAKPRLVRLLEHHGIEWYAKHPVRFTSESVMLGDRELETNTIIWTATPKGNRLFRDLDLPIDGRGFLVVDEHLQANTWLLAIGQSIAAVGKTTLGNRSGDALIEEGYAAARTIIAGTHKQVLPHYQPHVDAVTNVAIDKRHGLAWCGPFTWYGRFPRTWRAYAERRVARRAQKA